MTLLDARDEARSSSREEVPLTEPELVPYLFSSGVAVEAGESTVGLTAWVMHGMPGEKERRIQARLALPITAAMDLHRELGKVLRGGWRNRN